MPYTSEILETTISDEYDYEDFERDIAATYDLAGALIAFGEHEMPVELAIEFMRRGKWEQYFRALTYLERQQGIGKGFGGDHGNE